MTNVMHKFFSMYLFLLITLYMFRARRVHHQERQIVSIQPLVTFTVTMTVTRGCIDTIVSPDDENDVLETCREL